MMYVQCLTRRTTAGPQSGPGAGGGARGSGRCVADLRPARLVHVVVLAAAEAEMTGPAFRHGYPV